MRSSRETIFIHLSIWISVQELHYHASGRSDEIASLPRPVKELKGYTRLSLLPGESRSVTFHLPVNQLAFYDLDLKLVLEAGKFSVMIGSSSDDIRLMGEFKLGGQPGCR